MSGFAPSACGEWLDKLIDTVVYKDMKEGFLAEGNDHGTRELREIFKGDLHLLCSGTTRG